MKQPTPIPQLTADQWVLVRLLRMVANSGVACGALVCEEDFSRALQYLSRLCGGIDALGAACKAIEDEARQKKEARKAKEAAKEEARRQAEYDRIAAALASGDDTWIGG